LPTVTLSLPIGAFTTGDSLGTTEGFNDGGDGRAVVVGVGVLVEVVVVVVAVLVTRSLSVEDTDEVGKGCKTGVGGSALRRCGLGSSGMGSLIKGDDDEVDPLAFALVKGEGDGLTMSTKGGSAGSFAFGGGESGVSNKEQFSSCSF